MTDYGAEAPAARFQVVLLGQPGLEAERALELAGGQAAARFGWGEMEGLADALAGAPVLMVEAEGTGVDRLAEQLPGVAAAVDAARARVVAAFGPEAIDAVAASLFGAHVQLLCRPSFAERVAGLVIAGGRGGLIVPGVREDGPTGRMDRDMARIAEILARLGPGPEQLVPPLDASSVDDRRQGYAAEPPTGSFAVSPADIRRAIRARRLRDSFFAPALFADPAWDMLLDLFAAELEGDETSVSSLCIAAAVAPTTALRWLTRMTEDGLLERRPDPADRRRVFMALSPRARVGMLGYVAAVRRAGLSIA